MAALSSALSRTPWGTLLRWKKFQQILELYPVCRVVFLQGIRVAKLALSSPTEPPRSRELELASGFSMVSLEGRLALLSCWVAIRGLQQSTQVWCRLLWAWAELASKGTPSGYQMLSKNGMIHADDDVNPSICYRNRELYIGKMWPVMFEVVPVYSPKRAQGFFYGPDSHLQGEASRCWRLR